MVDPHRTDADERQHPPGSAPGWEEAWYFDFVAAGGRVAGYARLGLPAAGGRAWWWTAVVGEDLPFVLVRDHDIDPPRGGGLEIRGPGLWAEPVCETPFDHWSLGLEAFALGFDDPADAFGAERGDPVPLGLDLEWEAGAEPHGLRDGYAQACTVHGEVLVGRERFPVTGTGTRDHRWGPRDWWATESTWAAGTLDDGTPVPPEEPTLDLDADGLLAGGRLAAGHELRPVAHAPLQVPAQDGPASRLARALCRVEDAAGALGWAWAERLQPASSTSR